VADNSFGAWILMGNGDGTFDSAVGYSSGSPESIATGDFDNDDDLDLALSNFGPSFVSILLGNGDGTFGPSTSHPVGTNPADAAVGDFNGDGNDDVAAANQLSGNVSILLSNGDGTFSGPGNYPAGSAPVSIAVVDLDGDGILDLAVANAGTSDVSMLFGFGNGSFAAPVDYGAGAFPRGIASGDLNGDGTHDLAVSNFASDDVSIILTTSACASISLIVPNSGPNAGGQNVAINGQNLSGATSVTFGGIPAAINGNTDSVIGVTTPAHASGLVDVVVITAGGTATAVNGYAYTGPSDLSITKTLSGSPLVAAGSNVTYEITVTNSGPGAATAVLVTDVIPAGTTFVSAAPSQGSCSGNTTVTCAIGSLASGASATVTLVVRTSNTPGPVSNTANVASAEVDPNPANNASTAAFATVNPVPIPTLPEWGLIVLGTMLATMAVTRLRS
jgi:uncharacterized repeat protein (TIGR01451 family)